MTASAVRPIAAGPSLTDPLCGLPLLQKIAIVGSGRYLELAAKPVVYTWESVAIQGITVGMTGAPGEGKTTLMFLLVCARASRTGAKVLGLTVTPAPEGTWSVVVEAEHGEESAARKLVKSARALGLDVGCLDRVITVARKSVLLGGPEWAEIERMISAGIVADVFVDSISRFAPADSNSEEEQAAIFERLAKAIELSKGIQPTFWMVMHSRKGGTTGNTEDISGSQQRGGQVDSVLRCTAVRKEGRIVASSVTFPKLREDPDEHPGTRVFAIAREAGAWVYRDVDGDGPADSEPEDQILAYLRTHGDAAPTKIRDAIGLGGKRLNDAIEKLKSEDRVRFVRAPRGRGWHLRILIGRSSDGVSSDESSDSSDGDERPQRDIVF